MTIMTVKECALQDERGRISPLVGRDTETTLVQSLVDNQSPVMKMWFVIMLLNLALFMLLIH